MIGDTGKSTQFFRIGLQAGSGVLRRVHRLRCSWWQQDLGDAC